MDIEEAEQILADLLALAEGAREPSIADGARRLAVAVRGWERDSASLRHILATGLVLEDARQARRELDREPGRYLDP